MNDQMMNVIKSTICNLLENCALDERVNYINEIIDFTFNSYSYLPNQYHIIFRNYKNIIRNSNYIIPEIAECIKLENEEYITIKKTFWIRIIQRKWKKIFKIKQEVFRKRILSSSLRYREIYGKWPIDCRYNPTLKGMFYNLLKLLNL